MKLHLSYLSAAVLLFSSTQFSYAAISGDASKETTTHTEKLLTLSSMLKLMTEDTTLFSLSSLSYTFSGATADTINYIRLCNASSNTCSTCTEPFTVITAGTPIPYSILGTTYSINPASIAAYLTNIGSVSGNYNIGLYVQSASFNCSSSLAYCSTSVDSAASQLCINATFNGTAVTALSQNDNGAAVLSTPAAPFAYVANQTASTSTSTVSLCPVNSNGTFGTCIDSGLGAVFSSAQGIAVNASSTILYVVNGVNNTISKCSINSSNGTLDTCASTGTGFSGPRYITLNNIGTIAYVGNVGNNTVSKCPINSDGTFGACAGSGNTGLAFNGPRGIAVNSSRTFAYVANNGNNTVSKCPINSNGTFGACTDSGNTGTAFNSPRGVAINPAGTLAYVTNTTGSTVLKCPISGSTGSFGACASTGSGFNTPIDISINFKGTFAYVSNVAAQPNSSVSKCSINSTTGELGSCVSTGSGFNQPVGNLTTVVPN